MAQDIFEGTTLNLQAQVDKGKAETTEVTFTLTGEGDGFPATQTGKIESGPAGSKVAELKGWKVPNVPDGKENYLLQFKAKFDDQEINGTSSTIWPHTITIEAKDKGDGSPYPGFTFQVVQNKRETYAGATDSQGKCVFQLKEKGGFQVSAVPPYEVEWDAPDTGRKRTGKVTRRYQVEFLAPEKGAIRQWVNYDPEDEGQAGIGHEVTVEVGVKKEGGENVPTGSKDLEAHFRVTYGPKAGGTVVKSERKDTDHPTKVTKAQESDTATITEKEAGKKYEGKVMIQGGVGRFKVGLGKAGGDTCKVEISGSDKFLTDESIPADETLTFENWRHVHYELMVPDTMHETALETADLDFKAAARHELDTLARDLFIEFVHAGTCVFDTRRQADYGTLGPKRFFGIAEDDGKPAYVLSGRNWREPPEGQVWSELVPNKTLYIHLCDRLLKWRIDTDDEQAGTKDFSGTATEAKRVVDAQGEFGGLFMPFSGHDAGHGVTDLLWTADISKDDKVCKVSPQLTVEEFRFESPPSAELSVGLDGEATGAKDSLVFPLGPEGKVSSELSGAQVAQIKAYVRGMLSRQEALAEADGKEVVYVCCPEGDDRGESGCIASVKAKIKESFDELKQDFYVHPALDPDHDFSPRTGTGSMADWTDFGQSTVQEWHFRLPAVLANGSPGPGAFVGAEKTKQQCPVKFEFSFRPHEVSLGEADGKLLAWAWGDSGGTKQLRRLILQGFDGNGDKAGLAHGHGDGKPGDCLETADALCQKCIDYGRARDLTTLK